MKHSKKTCMNPACAREFVPGHYGDRQKVCGDQDCKLWYKSYWSSVRKPPRGIPTEVFERIKAALRSDPFHDSLVAVMGESGLRKGEALGLTWNDLFEASGKPKEVFEVRGQWDDCKGFKPMKAGTGKKAYLLDWGTEALARYHKVAKPKDRQARVWPIAESSCWRWWIAFQERLGIEKTFRVHDLRHSACVEVLRKTKDIRLAQKLLGHKKLENTLIYSERPDEEIRDEIARALRGKKKGA